MSNVPDYALEETIDFKFTSRAFSTGVPTTLAGTPAIEIYEDNSVTQITAAETLTVDFDSVTGLNNLRVVCSAANGFETGKSYQAVISAGTVDSVSVVGEVVAQWSIERQPVNWANVTNKTTANDLSGTDIQLCDTITTYTGNTVQTGDSFARLGAPAGASVSADIADVPTVAEFNARTLVAASYFDPAADTVANVTTVGTVTTLTGHTVQTGDSYALLGTVSNLGGGATVGANLSDMAGATFSTTTDTLEALRNRGDAAWTTGAGGTPPQLLQSTTIATLSTQTSFTLTAGSTDNDAYNGAVVVVTDQSTSTQKAVGSVSDYVGSTKTVTLSSDPGIFTMATGDSIDIIANASTAPSAAAVRAEIDSNSTQLAKLGTPAGASLAADIADIPTVAEFEARTLVAASYFDPAADTVVNVTNVATLTGHTVQTGDSYARLGAPAGLSVSADIADVPTVSEFNARTLVAASYFDPSADTVANVTNVATLTGHTVQTGDSFARLGVAGAGLTDLGGMSTGMKAEVNAEVVDTLQTDTPVAGVTIVEALRRTGAVVAYKLSGAGTGTETITDWADSASTIVVTVDGSGNKSAVTFN